MISPARTSLPSRVATPLVWKIALGLVFLLFSLWIIWFVAIPESLIADAIAQSLGKGGLKVVIVGLKKGIFCTLDAERVIVGLQPLQAISPSTKATKGQESLSYPNHWNRRDREEEVKGLSLRDVNVTPDLLSLLKFSPCLNFRGKVGSGHIQGMLGKEKRGSLIKASAAGLRISDMTVFKNAGIDGDGNMSFHLDWRDDGGIFQFEISSAKLKGTFPGINAFPLELFKIIRGTASMKDRVTVNPLTLEGAGLYVRLTGDIQAGNFDGRAELMLEPSSAHCSLLQTILAPYQKSPGYYVLPGIHAVLLSGWPR